MKPLERVVLQMREWREQEPTSHVLFPPSGDRTPVAIDTFTLSDGILRGFVLDEDEPVVALPADCNWIVYRRDLVNEITTEEAIRQTHARGLAYEELEKQLSPDGKKQPTRGREVMLIPADSEGGEVNTLAPGQYL